MKRYKSLFRFDKEERRGIFFLLVLIIILQAAYFLVKFYAPNKMETNFRFDAQSQAWVDSLKTEIVQEKTNKPKPFNPNFISDYKGYVLGLSVKEIDRLHAFREQDKFVNTAEEFQQVTKISDSLLQKLSPYFKFPDWVTSTKVYPTKKKSSTAQIKINQTRDLNTATLDDLKSINGIGDKLAARIIKFRDRLGGFLVNEQLYDVYYLEPQVAERVLQRFRVLEPPKIRPININTATADELASLVYIERNVARRIIALRQQRGSINSLDELALVKGFPIDKITRIGLYLILE